MKRCVVLLTVVVLAGGSAAAAGGQQTDYELLAKDIYAELIALRSTADMPEQVVPF